MYSPWGLTAILDEVKDEWEFVIDPDVGSPATNFKLS